MKILNNISDSIHSVTFSTQTVIDSLNEKIRKLWNQLLLLFTPAIISPQQDNPLYESVDLHVYEEIYDVSASNESVKSEHSKSNEPLYESIDPHIYEEIYDVPASNKPVKSEHSKSNEPLYEGINPHIYEEIYDVPTNNKLVKTEEPIYDIPTNNKLVKTEEPIYDIPTNNKLVKTEEPIYDIPTNNKLVKTEEPIYDVPTNNNSVKIRESKDIPTRLSTIYEEDETEELELNEFEALEKAINDEFMLEENESSGRDNLTNLIADTESFLNNAKKTIPAKLSILVDSEISI